MIFNHKCSSIFILCGPEDFKSVELIQGNCETYWPSLHKKQDFVNITVSNNNETSKAEHIIRDLEINLDGVSHKLKQYHFLAWPDNHIPGNRNSLGSLIDDLQLEETKGGPIVIHCSAGIGRTGTLLALTQLKSIISHQKKNNSDIGVSVFSIVRRLREQRPNMVYNTLQYNMIYDFVTEWIDKS